MYKLLTCTLLILPLLCVNPGIVVGVPLPYDIDTGLVNLPYPLESFTVESAEFTNVELKEISFSKARLEYKPKGLVIKECLALNLEVSYMRIHFDFQFEGSTGPGNYEEAGLAIYIEFEVVDNNGRPEIQTKRIEMDIGKIKVSFGGSVTDRVISILTNFLLQPGEPIIHNQVKKIIKSQIDNLNKRFILDFKLLDVMLDASLISAPTLEKDFFSLNLNGAAYAPNTKPAQLNPPDLLKVDKTKRIVQMLVHEQVLNSALACELKTSVINKTISTMNITSTIDINTEALTPVFPAMLSLPVQDVLLRFTEKSTAASISKQRINVAIGLDIAVSTQPLSSSILTATPYIDSITANLTLNLNLLFGFMRAGATITKLDLSNINASPSDITAGKVAPQALTRYLPVLQQWIMSGINGGVNVKTRTISPYGIGVGIAGALKEKYVAVELSI